MSKNGFEHMVESVLIDFIEESRHNMFQKKIRKMEKWKLQLWIENNKKKFHAFYHMKNPRKSHINFCHNYRYAKNKLLVA